MNSMGKIESLFTGQSEKMKYVARLMLGDETEAEDAVGDVFADVAGGKICIDGEKTEALLMTCLRNRCLNILRRKTLLQRIKQHAILDDDIEEASFGDAVDRMEEIGTFIDGELAPQTARIVKMHYQQHLKYKEISAMLGISETAVYKHLAKGIAQLRQKFNP